MASVVNRKAICRNFRNLLEFQKEEKENSVSWFRNNKLPRTPIMDTVTGRKEHNKSFKKRYPTMNM